MTFFGPQIKLVIFNKIIIKNDKVLIGPKYMHNVTRCYTGKSNEGISLPSHFSFSLMHIRYSSHFSNRVTSNLHQISTI